MTQNNVIKIESQNEREEEYWNGIRDVNMG
jgi:hypothetical protein